MSRFYQRFVRDESGATAIEYGLIAAGIAIAVAAAVTLLRPQITGAFSTIGGALTTAATKASTEAGNM